MFLRYALQNAAGAALAPAHIDALFQRSPRDVLTRLERTWNAGAHHGLGWHLMYAYMLENTRIVEIFRRVLQEMLHGERLGPPDATVQSWLRVTEDVFFSDKLGTWLVPPMSHVRPDGGAIRRNAYYRMFGTYLMHGAEDGRPYAYVRPEVANTTFVATLESLLREVWRGHINRNNAFTTNTTDDAAIEDLVRQLGAMLRDRRRGNALQREEFYSVALLSWLHATVTTNNSVMRYLRTQGANAGDRLRMIGERVGLPAHSRSYHFCEIAPLMSQLLTRIEANVNVGPAQLYGAGSIAIEIIHHWSMVTDKNLKHLPDAGPAALSQPVGRMLEAG